MSEEMVVQKCSPTLAGLKTGSLFSCPREDRAKVLDCVRQFNRCLVPRGVRMIPLKFGERHTLIYLYRPQRLQKDLKTPKARAILAERGYCVDNPQRCVAQLISRLAGCGEFPHEIGLFLGYPAEDVEQFIRQEAKNAKLVGTWKVYGDVEGARRKFELFGKCTRLYRESYRRHHSFARLVVSCK